MLSDVLMPGALFAGQFRLERKLGEGGMGALYLAHQVEIDRRVAIKFVHPHLLSANPENLARFRQEARALAQINHPHVIQLYTYGQTESGQPYFVMEFVAGQNLAVELERGPMLLARALEVTKQIASGLGAAHERGIIHRDLKPENIMFLGQGTSDVFVKLVDFGIASVLDARSNRLTQEGFVCGTPQYMAPEQIQGDPLDARTDLYGLGLVLFEMLTGRTAFSGRTPYDLVQQHMATPAPAPRSLRPDLPHAIDQVVLRCLEKDPARRFASAQELIAALAQIGAAVSASAGAPVMAGAVVPSPLPNLGSTEVHPTPAAPSTPPARLARSARVRKWRSRARAQRAEREEQSTTSSAEGQGSFGHWFRWVFAYVPSFFVMIAIMYASNPSWQLSWSSRPFNRLTRLYRSLVGPDEASPAAPATAESLPVAASSESEPPTQPALSPASTGDVFASDLNEVIDDCLNRHARRAYDSYFRYTSWVDAKTGPSARRRSPLGLYTLYEVKDCQSTADEVEDAHFKSLATRYAAALGSLASLVEEADRYYENEAWKDDEFAKGKALHPELKQSFSAFASAERALRDYVVPQRESLDQRLLDSLRADGDATTLALQTVRVEVRALVALGNRPLDEIELSAFSKACERTKNAIDALDANHEFQSVVERGRSLLVVANQLRHRLSEPGRGSRADRERMTDRLSGWMTNGSPAQLVNEAERFVQSVNRPLQRDDVVELNPVLSFTPPPGW